MLLRGMRAVAALVAVALLSGCGVHVEFSPDGNQLLVSGGAQGLVVLNADGSGRTLLPNTKDAAYAIWSPDGRYILYEDPDWSGNRTRSRVFLYDLRTASARPLRGYLCAPYTFSHDGRQVVAWDAGQKCLVWVDVPSGERLLEVSCPVTPQDPRLYWLPDRQGVVFTAQVEGKGSDVYTVEAGQLYRLSTTGDVVGAGVSPDGKRVLWARQTGLDANAVVTTFAYDLDARTVQKLPLQVKVRDLVTWRPPKGATICTRVEFSPDAQSVVLMVKHFTKNEPLWHWYRGVVFPLSGGQTKEVFRTLFDAKRAELPVGVAWSPDSGRIAVLAIRGTKKDKEETVLRLRVLPADGKGQKVVDLS